jgi:hypothetical protein
VLNDRWMETWELMPRRGIRSGGVELLIGMSRAAARDALGHTMAGPESHFPNEDDCQRSSDVPGGRTVGRRVRGHGFSGSTVTCRPVVG